MRNIFIFWIVFAQSFFPAIAQVVNGGKIPGTYAPGLSSEKNYVINGSCEKNATTGLAASGGTLARGTTTPLNEDSGSECTIDASASGQTYTWSFNTFGERLKGGNCGVEFIYQGDASLYKAYVKNGSTQVTEDLTLTNVASGAQDASINFPCGDLLASNTFVIEATDNAAAAISVIVPHVGKARNIGTVAQATHIGTLKYLGTTSCQWSSASTTLANFAADTDCPTPSVTGSVTAPGTKIPGAVLSNLAPGTYKVTVKTNVSKGGTVDAVVATAISDGTSTSAAQHTYANTTDGAYGFPITLVGYFTYTTAQSSVTFQVQGVTNSGSNTVKVTANFASQADFEMAVEYFPSQSQTAVRMDQSNYDWTAFTPSTVGSQGFGTIAAESCFHKRAGKNMLINCKFTAGTVTAAEARITLPDSRTISSTEVPAIRLAEGFWVRNNTTGAAIKRGPILMNGGQTYVTFSRDDTAGTANPLVSDLGNAIIANSEVVAFFASVPIQGWTENQNAPMLKQGVVSRDNTTGVTTINTVVSKSADYTPTADEETIRMDNSGAARTVNLPAAASFKGKRYLIQATSSSNYVVLDPNASETICGQATVRLYGAEDAMEIYSDGSNWKSIRDCWRDTWAKVTTVCSANPCTISSQKNATFSSIGWGATGSYTGNFATGAFSAAPACKVQTNYLGSGNFRNAIITSSPTTSGFGFTTFITTTAASENSGFEIVCQGPR